MDVPLHPDHLPPPYDPKQWELRWHPLRAEWVVVAAHRDARPWQGESVAADERTERYDAGCYLCPGNVRANGERNPDYTGTFVFDNDFPPAGAGSVEPTSVHGIYRARPAYGRCRVVCFHPRHDLSLSRMELSDVERVVETWQREYRMLGADPGINHVLTFENRGEIVGTSNQHPHGQIYGTSFVFSLIEREVELGRQHMARTGETLYASVIRQELDDELRVIEATEGAIAFVPYFARYAYEVHVAPRQPRASVADLTDDEVADFAGVLSRVQRRYDNLWEMPFPYVMAFHQAPTNGEDHSAFHFHVEFLPPLRNPGTRKYLAGPEIGGGNMLIDVTPEVKAAELRACSTVHYTRR